MAMIDCPTCGKSIADTAPRCPHCGARAPRRARINFLVFAAVLAVVAVFVIQWGWSTH